jgi:hypothetical protein
MDGDLSDVFELQDQITARVVSSIAPTIEQAEIKRLKQQAVNTLDSYDTFLRGMALFYQRQPAAARNFFKMAAEQDPEYAAAYAMAANTYTTASSLLPKCGLTPFDMQTMLLTLQTRMPSSWAGAAIRLPTSVSR